MGKVDNCSKCGRPHPTPRARYCNDCSREYQRVRGARNKAAGLCFCGRENAPDRERCPACIASRAKMAASNLADGRCQCGRPRSPGLMRCKACRATARRSTKKLSDRNLAAGLCRCGRETAGTALCSVCRERNLKSLHGRRDARAAAGLCKCGGALGDPKFKTCGRCRAQHAGWRRKNPRQPRRRRAG